MIDCYQERLSVLAQEENCLGGFLKENGRQSQNSCKTMVTAGKAICYSGQQRMTIRAPLMRLHSELETFRTRAIADTQSTISAMERERTEYRAALSWMKSVSGQLDPDSDKGLDKFRKAQNHVRVSKQKFDRLALDCLEKIDLLSAARCNMFSHVLVAYQLAMQNYSSKTLETFKVASKILDREPHYSFSILKDLTQAEKVPQQVLEASERAQGPTTELADSAIDADQFLFFQDEFTDNKNEKSEASSAQTTTSVQGTDNYSALISIDKNDIECPQKADQNDGTACNLNLLEDDFLLDTVQSAPIEMPSELLLDIDFDFLKPSPSHTDRPPVVSGDATMDLLDQPSDVSGSTLKLSLSSLLKSNPPSSKAASKKGGSAAGGKHTSSWFQLFSELDPLANPDAMFKQIEGSDNNHSA